VKLKKIFCMVKLLIDLTFMHVFLILFKKDYLIDLIVKQKFFGEVAAFIYVIELKKCGLPHVHMLVTLKYNFKITTPQIVDKYISAEIPDP